MGVRGLQTYLEKCCKATVYIQNIVSIEELALKHRISENQELIIVVDGINCIKHVYGDLSWIGGGQLSQYGEKMKKFVKAFRNVGIRLIFYFDGFTVQKKRATWVRRRMVNIDKAYHILGKVEEGAASDPISFGEFFILPPGVLLQTKFFLENICGCEVYLPLVFECDDEIAEFARRKEVFGILAHDTDFLIYDIGQAIFFDTDGLDVEKMIARVYNPDVIAQSLGLYKYQLPLLATLIGNEIIKYDELRNFHYNLLLGKERVAEFLIPSVAGYIKTLPIYYLRRSVLSGISEKVFGTAYRAVDIEKSVNSYKALIRTEEEQDSTINEISLHEDSRREEDKQWLDVVSQTDQLFHENKLPDKIFTIVKKQLYEASTALEDFRISPRDLPIFAELTLLLRQRLYGILLLQQPSALGSHQVEEWCVAGPGSCERPCYVSAVAPCAHHPGLLALWGEEDRPDGPLNDIRWTLFVRSVSPRLDLQKVRQLPAHIVIPALITHYVLNYRGPGWLEEWEADVFLATAAVVPFYSGRELAAIPSDPMTSRSIRVSNILMRCGSMLCSLLAACGYPLSIRETGPWRFFDGKLFQLKYRECEQYRNFYSELCDKRADSIEAFQLARRVMLSKYVPN